MVISNYEVCRNMAEYYIKTYRVTATEIAIIVSTCESIVNPVDPGLAGGFHATIYHGFCNKGLYLDASVRAPMGYVPGSTKCFADTGVPLMLKGYQYLYNMKICGISPALEWKDLFTENINLAKNGWHVKENTISKVKRLTKSLVIDEKTKLMKNPLLAKTLEMIALDGPSSSLYDNDSVFHSKMIQELGDRSFISSSDLARADVNTNDTFEYDFLDYKIITTTSPPGSGSCLILGLKIIESAVLELRELSSEDQVIFLYHTLRYMYSMKPFLDENPSKVDEIIKTAPNIAQDILSNLNKPWKKEPITEFNVYKIDVDPSRFTPKSGVNDIVIRRGKFAISMSTVTNRRGGQKLFSNNFGMVYNNLLRDFDGTLPTRAANKQPLSYSAATILHSKDRKFEPVFTIGATAQLNPFGSILNVMFQYFVNEKTLTEANVVPYCSPKYRQGQEFVVCDNKIVEAIKLFRKLGAKEVMKFSDNLHGGVTASSTVRDRLESVFDVQNGGAVYKDHTECRSTPNGDCFGLDVGPGPSKRSVETEILNVNPRFRK